MSTWPTTSTAAAIRCALFLAFLVQGEARGAFSIAPGEEELVARGERPVFLAAIERARHISPVTVADPRPRTELSGLLISRARPISAEEPAPATGRRPVRSEDGEEGDLLGERGVVLVLAVALAGLSFAAYCCFRRRLKERA